MTQLLNNFLELLFPTKCVFCHKLTGSPRRTICEKCYKALPYTPDAAQEQKLPHVAACYSPLYYEGDVRASLHRYKFSGLSFYDKLYGELISECIAKHDIAFDIVTWVPVSKRRLRSRGYDQAKLLAVQIAKHTGKPCEMLLRKRVHNRAQSVTGSAEKRRANVKGVYTAENTELINGRTVLILDDIVTTGATISEAAGVLRKAGADKVYAATLARKRE